ncbi:sulfatase [Rubripirellula reticaptiva]|uniref:Arylsulfatase n=1 Tax=Rubripirellula reticaptiva TaxID=2528013 RepID=A0A5C6F3K1_9BACT|nr:sulfatase [Rubripirellula reticaptiva]TWU55908.1 Arylsulfatase [Rubripirellula reticaptiva]
MTRRSLTPLFCTASRFAAALLLGIISSTGSLAIAAERPNIVLLLADDLGWTGLGCYGSDFYETPNLDALAQRGVKFTNAYAACTVCSPTRASIMTGQYPARLHLTDFIAGQFRPHAKLLIPDWTKRLGSEHITIAEVLKNAGYRTGHIGKWHLNGRGAEADGTMPTDQGFDVSFERPPGSKGYLLKQPSTGESQSSYLTDLLTDQACEFIDESKSDPFFLYFAYNVPHTPIDGRRDLVKQFNDKLDTKAKHNNPSYAAMVASLDQSAGRIVAQLDKNGLTENTVIVFYSDNGGLTQRNGQATGFTDNTPLRRGKGSAYEGGVRVPAVVHWPGVTSPSTVCDTPIITMDLFPTFQEMAGVQPDSQAVSDGTSLVTLLRTPATNIDRDMFWHYPHYHAGGDSPYSAIRSGEFRLIEFHEDNRIELYNLPADISERHDLAASLPEKAQQLQTKLHQWQKSVGAQFPTANPKYSSARETEVAGQK